jgi:hypothetical protein
MSEQNSFRMHSLSLLMFAEITHQVIELVRKV